MSDKPMGGTRKKIAYIYSSYTKIVDSTYYRKQQNITERYWIDPTALIVSGKATNISINDTLLFTNPNLWTLY
jgi:hypothetical protein